jgi:hypothetical protein
MQEMLQRLEMSKIQNTPLNPQSDGMVERCEDIKAPKGDSPAEHQSMRP